METCAPAELEPVFLLGFHRGGTTFVQRLLNCHLDLVVWGEQGGMLNELARMHQCLKSAPLVKVDAADYAGFADFAETFEPWASPATAGEMLRLSARHLDQIYSDCGGIARWGLKEIRYNNDATLHFLMALFPRARFLFLRRDPLAVYRSRLHVRWSEDFTGQDMAEHAREFYREYRYEFGAMERFRAVNGRNVMMLETEDIAQRRVSWEEILAFLDLAPDRYRANMAEKVYAKRVGSSFGDVGKTVDPGLVEEACAVLAGLLAEGDVGG
jgi:hypothetical protein